MDDRQLLEMAARAAGLMSHRYCEPWNAMAKYTMQDGYFGPSWNPLTDDGDALRLAVKLRLLVDVSAGHVKVMDGKIIVTERASRDATAATRRAITRAAASIGAKGERT